MNDMNDREEWLDSLKPGNEVYVDSEYTWAVAPRIGVVKRRTPRTKVIVVDCGGYERSFDAVWGHEKGVAYSRISIRPVTQEIRDEVEREKLVNSLAHFKYDTLDLASLRAIHGEVKKGIVKRDANE